MVQILRDYIPGSTELLPFEFKVYRSPKDGRRVLGYLAPYGVIHGEGRKATWIQTPWGVLARDAFKQTLDLADEYGIDTVWVNDPQNLCPDIAA